MLRRFAIALSDLIRDRAREHLANSERALAAGEIEEAHRFTLRASILTELSELVVLAAREAIQ